MGGIDIVTVSITPSEQNNYVKLLQVGSVTTSFDGFWCRRSQEGVSRLETVSCSI